MNAKDPRILVLLSTILLTIPVAVLGGGRVPDNCTSVKTAMRQVHDESDPDGAQPCYALGQLDITFHTEKTGPPTVGMVVTDPRGRRIGFDPLKKHGWQELPEAQGFIDCDAPDGGGACQGAIQLCGPISGTYKLEVIAQQSAVYSLTASGKSQDTRGQHGLESSRSLAELNDIAIPKGARDTLLLNYSRDLESKISLQPQQTSSVAPNQ